MKHSTIAMVLALAATSAAPLRAQQAPPAPAIPPAQPTPPAVQAPPPTPTPPAPTEAGAQQAPPPLPPGATPPAPPPTETITPPAAPVPAPSTAAPSSTPIAVTPPGHTAAVEPTSTEIKPIKPLLGLAIGTPDTGGLPGRFRPAFGVPPKSANDFKFDFHGYLSVPLRFGVNEREDPLSTQYDTVFHGPPLVPDDFERFEHTGVVPEPWVQLGFSYGNARAVANIIIAARSVSNASGFFNPPTQLGINDAFVSFKPDIDAFDLEIDVGGFANRYGAMGDYDLGRYDTPLIARVGGVGETARARVALTENLAFLAEHGVMGQFDRAPLGVEPAGWNSFADPNVGTSFAHHAHLGVALLRRGQVGLHYVNAWTRDDRTAPSQPDGTITVFGADITAELAPFGRLYAAAAHTSADTARGVSGVIRVLNTFGGPGLMREYLGPNSRGTGTLTTLGGQYDVSIGEVVRNPQPFSGYGPDVIASLFGVYTHVTSDDPDYDGVDKVKYGGELTYSAFAWLAFSGRYDRVVANTDDASKTFAVLSPRIILRTDYNSQDQVTLQYSRWFHGSGVVVRPGYAPCTPLTGTSPDIACGDPSIEPDSDTFSLTANMWW